MAIFSNSIIPAAAAAAAADVVTKSVRFNNPDTPSISFSPSSTGDQKKWTTAFWFKRSKLSYTNSHLFGAESHSGNDGIAAVYLLNNNKLTSYFDTSGANPYGVVNDRLYRDPAGWMQIIWAVDAVNTIQKIWINGVEESVASATNPVNYAYAMNQSGYAMKLGCRPWDADSNSFDGYIAQFVHLDGQYITDPTEFGQVSSTTGEWEPIELTSSSFTYGTNGALLEFLQTGTSADSSGIGADTSGNGNHWSVSNLAASDVVEDTPTDNYCTMNRLDTHSSNVLSEGNLNFGSSGSAGHYPTFSTMGMRSGKWYWEVLRPSGQGNGWKCAIMSLSHDSGSLNLDSTVGNQASAVNKVGYSFNGGGTKAHDTSSGSYGSAIGSGEILMVAFDADNGKLYFGKDGTWFDSSDPANSTSPAWSSIDTDTDWGVCIHCYSGHLPWINFGADPTFGGNVSTPDTSEFKHTPPSGFKSLSTGNLPTPAIAKPSEHFSTKLYSGTGNTTQNITGVGFQPDLVWIKNRNTAVSHYLLDSVRGLYQLNTASTTAEYASTNRFNSFDTDGFQVEHSGGGNGFTNGASQTYAAWSWKGGTTLTQSGTHTYELTLELTDSGGDGWGDWGSYTTPQLRVWEGATSLGYASHLYDGDTTQYYTIKTNNKDAIKIVWDYDSLDGGTLYQQGVTLKNGATTMATWTTSQLVEDGEVLQAQSTSTDETTVGTLSTGAPASYPSSNYNADAGFSIAKWTGDDTGSGSGQTVNHNLGVAPEMIIAKNRTSTASGNGDWMVYHKDVTSGYYMRLNTNDAETLGYTNTMQSITSVKVDFYSDTGAMNYLNYGGGMGYAAEDYIAYMFASVEGYSKVGKYVGSGVSGNFIYLGFRPQFLIYKHNASGHGWHVLDDKREPYNPLDTMQQANQSLADTASPDFDLLSNGFRIHDTTGPYNQSSEDYIFYAVGQSLKYANAR